MLEEMCASNTPDLHLSKGAAAGGQKHMVAGDDTVVGGDDASSSIDTSSVWKDPMVISFTIVGVLFALSVILGALNIYIWYIEKRNRRHNTGMEQRIGGGYGYTPTYESTSSKNRSTNLAFMFMGRGRQQGGGGGGDSGGGGGGRISKMARQTSVAGNR